MKPVIDITKENYIEIIRENVNLLEKDDLLYLVISGGDGSCSLIIKELMDLMDISKIVFIPMPIGTGNDFS